MELKTRKVVLVGTGFVGMSYAYAMLNQNVCDELVLIDIDRQRAEGEAMDLNHGLPFSGSHMKIYAGDYQDCADADLVAICAGAAQKPGEERTALLHRNAEVFRAIISPIVSSGFGGILLIATNPVDIMAHVAQTLSGFDSRRVIGTGTILDTARLRYQIGRFFRIDPRNVHAYVMGEHGESEFVPWSQAMVATKPVGLFRGENGSLNLGQMLQIETEVRDAAQKIILAKKATYYGIGMAMVRITRAILGDEQSVLTVSTMMRGDYRLNQVYLGTPCIVGRRGVAGVVGLPLEHSEQEKLEHSAQILSELYQGLRLS
ncbi:L-lactate dehydrogenase 2 [Eubacteriales bacterium]|nr:L-lactate dehydrogenase [Faecalicatena sp. BF-R-105]GKH50265.1 L-lactate dehydrogenase 2 [Eubacteriales bacterium]GKH62902.1 L-lactate dehydrogenase 2 [Eubacteriales bacterium]